MLFAIWNLSVMEIHMYHFIVHTLNVHTLVHEVTLCAYAQQGYCIWSHWFVYMCIYYVCICGQELAVCGLTA